MTGEHAAIYALANRGPVTCTVHGYPQVVLYGANGDVLPFRYATGGGAYVTSGKPVTVVLAHGATVWSPLRLTQNPAGFRRQWTGVLRDPGGLGGTCAPTARRDQRPSL
jgi:hypothetical protein